ncbi:MAG: tryptophan synthase subunit beta [bacterium]|nr:tryptophan synthase subunit beta [bacterium]
MIQVKVCGITRVEDAQAAVEAGVDAIGLNFVDGTPRALDLETARAISAAVAGRVVRVGVFQDAPVERVAELVEEVGLDVVQLHGDESPDYVGKLPFPVIKVLAAQDGVEELADRYPRIDLMLDHPSGGGSGESWDYTRARSLESRGRRVWIAGGLAADNVEDAARSALPHGVDASSRLESAPGRKDRKAVREFVALAHSVESERDRPDPRGYFGIFGGRYVPETLVPATEQLTDAYEALREDPSFWQELAAERKEYVGRPTPLYFARRISEDLGCRVYFKRDELAHTGAHKINNAIGQALIAKRMGKTRIIAETGAGQHGVATATACARYGLQCEVFMGEEDTRRQALNVFRMELLGAKVHAVTSGTRTLKDAMSEALRDWATNVLDTYYLIGSAAGPHPYPLLVRDLQAIIGQEAREQILAAEGRLPDYLYACVGGGSNAIGLFHPFFGDEGVKMIGVEAAGEGMQKGRHSAPLTAGSPGVLHGSMSYLLQDDSGQVFPAHSISAGLDYPGVGPEHSLYKDSGRAIYSAATDDEALDAFVYLSQKEGIIPAFEPSHAIAELRKRAADYGEDTLVIVNLCGRGDKDVAEARLLLEKRR